MRIAHILRKYHPAEWGGTETAVKRLLDGLRAHQADGVLFCPRRRETGHWDPIAEAGHRIERFRAFLPVLGIGADQRRQLVAVGGNLMSLDLIWKLRREPGLSLIHTHTLNRLGGIASTVSRIRGLPFVVTIHGGVLDLPPGVREKLAEPMRGGFEWGRIFGCLVRSRKVLDDADAIVTCNRTEAARLRERYPSKIIYVQPHGVSLAPFEKDHRSAALEAYPFLADSIVLLAAGRIDPVKNQAWLVEQFPPLLQHFPKAHLVIAGPCTDEAYGKVMKKEIRNAGLESRVTLTGGFPPDDCRLLGLFQHAAIILVPSLSETFGLVILEAWAAGAPVLSSRTSGALDLIRDGQDGWLFDLANPQTFHAALAGALDNPDRARTIGLAGQGRVRKEFDGAVLAGRMKHLYEELIAGQDG
jgi:starch synthase